MQTCLLVIFTGLAVIFRLAGATVEPTAAAPSSEIHAWVRDLSNERFRVRENASREIWNLGEAALPALREALRLSDPESVLRARDLIRKIQLQITPETDPAVTASIERYAKASLTEKTTLFANLRMKGAWRQMLQLYAAESDPSTREKLLPSIHGIAVKAARERMLQGQAQEAQKFLAMAPAGSDSLLALAEFHRSHGTLEAELKRARTVKGHKSQVWQLALERASGDLDAAQKSASTVSEPRVAAAMAALSGDPLPWLHLIQQDPEPDAVLAAYTRAASRRWSGQPVRPADLDPLSRLLSSRNPVEQMSAINASFLLGAFDTAEATLVKSQPLNAFRYFESCERIPAALKALGLDPEHPDYPAWVTQYLQKLPADDIEDQHEPADQGGGLAALANFLERRGLHEEAAAAFSEPLVTLATKDFNAFINLLGTLFGNRETQSGAPVLAKRIAATWAGQDAKRWDEITIAALGEDDWTKTWSDWLTEMNPNATQAERLDAMLSLLGVGPDPSRRREKSLAMAWQAVAAVPVEQRHPLVARIASLCLETGDVANSLKAWDLLPENERKKVMWSDHILDLSAVDRWNETAAVILQQIALIKESKQEASVPLFAYAAAALRLAGRHDEAAAHDALADQLALGNPAVAIQIGQGYAFGRDYRRAAEWWARAARQADPDSGEFAIALKLHSEGLLEEEKWRECAATTEVLAAIYVASDYRAASPQLLLRQRLQADTARALSILKTDRTQAISLLENCHRLFASDGSLADFFFPALRKVGLIKEHDAWFLESWNFMQAVIARYPESDNTRNTAAWFASRALRKLDEAGPCLAKALATNPDQAAYLDTMAEIQFAKGNREKALEWSRTAINFMPDDPQLRRQHERFRADPFPQ